MQYNIRENYLSELNVLGGLTRSLSLYKVSSGHYLPGIFYKHDDLSGMRFRGDANAELCG